MKTIYIYCFQKEVEMKTLRVAFSVMLILIGSLVFANGGSEETVSAEPESGELVFWHPYSGSRIDSLRAAADKFEEDNEGWTVRLEKIGWGEDMRNKWVTGLASNTLPDLFGATLDHALAMYDAGASVPAGDAINALGGADAFLKQPLNTLHYKGEYIAVPHYGHAKTMYYRADWLKEAGLGVPTTWDELRKVALATTQPPNRYGLIVPLAKEGSLAVDFFYIFMTSNGGGFFDKKGNVILNSPENLEALKLLMFLYENASPEGAIAYSDRERDDLLFNGICGITFAPLFTSGAIAKNAPDLWPKFNVARPPAGPKGIGWMSEHLVISLCSGSEFESKRLELLPYFFAEEEYVRFLHHAPGGMLPVLKTTTESDTFWNNDFIKETRDDIEIALEGYAAGTPVGMSRGLNNYAGLLKGTTVIKDMFHDIVAGKPMEQALADTEKKLIEMIAEQQG
ncbi:hypothetical protein CSA56_18490 [candidate division KSB3 bacterium]|uniref:Sugar ABC transporter substrate-binding protein n=1 Tax=candidate division KSB3 bacterium TaxID=2044937 RepID=A0A2G6K6P5_9BACT|nr:MAG: hypothetical protein CSA56_18490 [candidate division KSB3 bacterium]